MRRTIALAILVVCGLALGVTMATSAAPELAPVNQGATPMPAWVSEFYGAAEAATPCVNWNLRGGCGANDDFAEVSIGPVATPLSLAGWSLQVGQCVYRFPSDNMTGPVKVIYADDMVLATPTP